MDDAEASAAAPAGAAEQTPGMGRPAFRPMLRSDLTNDERVQIACRVWGEPLRANLRELMTRCADVADVDTGQGIPSMSAKERDAVELAILEHRAARTRA